jgi:RNA polymerase sigma-70 factor, ECF subfamily
MEASDDGLMAAFYSGDQDAFGVIFTRHWPGLLRFFLRRSVRLHDAEDLAEQTFLNILATKENPARRFDPDKGSFTTWLYSIASHRLSDHHRKQGCRKKKEAEILAAQAASPDGSVGPTPHDAWDRREATDQDVARSLAVLSALEELSPEESVIIVLRYFKGLGYHATADLLRLPFHVVNNFLNRTMQPILEQAAAQPAPTHPPVVALLLWRLGELPVHAAEALRRHVEALSGMCRRCRQLANSAWAKEINLSEPATLVAIWRTLRPAAVASASLPAPVGAFEPVARPPFRLMCSNADNTLAVHLRETDDGELVAEVYTPHVGYADRVVSLEILGRHGALRSEVQFTERDADGWTGRCRFGRFAELLPQLGTDMSVLAVVREMTSR